jgi:hypothetical protein
MEGEEGAMNFLSASPDVMPGPEGWFGLEMTGKGELALVADELEAKVFGNSLGEEAVEEYARGGAKLEERPGTAIVLHGVRVVDFFTGEESKQIDVMNGKVEQGTCAGPDGFPPTGLSGFWGGEGAADGKELADVPGLALRFHL